MPSAPAATTAAVAEQPEQAPRPVANPERCITLSRYFTAAMVATRRAKVNPTAGASRAKRRRRDRAERHRRARRDLEVEREHQARRRRPARRGRPPARAPGRAAARGFSAAAAGASTSATSSRLPRPWTAATVVTASTASSASSQRAGGRRATAPSRGRSRRARASGARPSSASATPTASAPATARSPASTPSRSPNSSSCSRGGDAGESASIAPRPNSADTQTATPTSPRQALVARHERDPGRRHEHAAGRAEHQRRAGQRGDHEPGQHAVADRLRGVGVAVEQHPHAERPAREREDQHLDQRALRRSARRTGR